MTSDRAAGDPDRSSEVDLLGDLAPADDVVPAGDAPASDAPDAGRRSGWRGMLRANRALWITALVATGALVAGLLVGTFVVAPAGGANAAAPAAGLVTVPVEFGELSNDVTVRADVGYADATEVTIDTASVEGPAVVTGQVPATGAELNPLSIALEVAGRPVIVLPGELPAYRTLRFGVSGPDVVQLKNALRAVGIDGGDPASDRFDESTAAGVDALYTAAGYPAPGGDASAAATVRAAEQGLQSARQSLGAASADLGKAASGASAVEIRQADNEVAAAQRAVADAQAAGEAPSRIANLQDDLALAQLRREQLSAAPDTSAQRAARDAAREQVAQAEADLARAREAALTALPSSEVLYLSSLPRRVDEVTAKRGSVLQGKAMTVSGATVQLTGSVASADARLLTVGGKASFALPDGAAHTATIAAITPASGKDANGRWSLTLTPDPLSTEQIQQIQGSNVRVSIPVGATDGKVLSVPLAALSAGTGGEARVEVVVGDPRDPRAQTRLVTVQTGLSAKGVVEVTPSGGELTEGDLVVVGK